VAKKVLPLKAPSVETVSAEPTAEAVKPLKPSMAAARLAARVFKSPLDAVALAETVVVVLAPVATVSVTIQTSPVTAVP
jgi:hypothetical protein